MGKPSSSYVLLLLFGVNGYWLGLAVHLLHVGDEFENLVRVTDLIVVPANYLNEGVSQPLHFLCSYGAQVILTLLSLSMMPTSGEGVDEWGANNYSNM